MQATLAALSLLLLAGMVLFRILWLRRSGTRAMHFGRLDKTDFLLPPLMLFYIYTILAAAFGWPLASTRRLFQSEAVAWAGAALCLSGVIVMLLSLASFGRSFRVGIDVEHPDQLVTTGIFALSRNPIYVAFGLVLLGQFLVFPNWVPLAYLLAGTVVIHRQVLREEAFLRQHYGEAYTSYCRRVRRYV
ncbi:MAG TPA: isoprenylcysteine carboxylmethyltransferase family protein [Promineifilum sp.]|nr:isoprenylcysteine carboxylmethyltransferase family protein [Promineifilum sp.]